MQNLIIVTKCNPKSQNPSWIHADMTLAIIEQHGQFWLCHVLGANTYGY
jgi:hypothetical protein